MPLPSAFSLRDDAEASFLEVAQRLLMVNEGFQIDAGGTGVQAALDSLVVLAHNCHSLPMATRSNRDEIPPGTLYLLILRTLSRREEMHGYEIANAIQRISDDVLQVEEGSLYPALQRMLLKGWVTAEWGVTAGNRRARYYRLTAAGQKQLTVEFDQYRRVNGAIEKVLQMA
jgi:PadR family transcriptional regulator PadR